MAYRTVKQASEIELVIKRSRFICRCFPVSDEPEALRILEQIRKQHWDATHNCFAYSIGTNGSCARYSDDGEPSGTAGVPMLDTIRLIGITDVLVIVTRYFGGVLLGAGGLIRAYSRSTTAAVRAAGQVEMRQCAQLLLDVPYPLWGRLEPMLRECALIDGVKYGAEVSATVCVDENESAAFSAMVFDRTDGRVTPRQTQALMRAFSIEMPALLEESKEE